jgi:hypothetical protein
MRNHRYRLLGSVTLFFFLMLACRPSFLADQPATPTATPTKTPKPPPAELTAVAEAIPTDTPTPVPIPTDTATPPPPATATEPPPEPTATETVVSPTETSAPPTDTPVPAPPTATPEPTIPPTPETAYRIVHFKVLGDGENNGGIFNSGGQHLIFLTVLDANGNGVDGAIVKDDNGSSLEVVTGDKGPGKAEISMEWDPFKLFVAADPAGPTTSEISTQMNTAYPHIPDVVGKLGGLDNEYSVCPTIDVRCEPPFYNVHFSYEITFQKVGP